MSLERYHWYRIHIHTIDIITYTYDKCCKWLYIQLLSQLHVLNVWKVTYFPTAIKIHPLHRTSVHIERDSHVQC